MLNLIKGSKKTFRSSIALLFFISCVTFQTFASEGIKEETAEEYRALGYEEQQKGNLNEALSHYTKAISLGLENAVLLNDMGVLYEEIDLYNRAEQFYLRSIQSDRNYLPPYNNLAYLYQRLGKKDQAAQYFKMRYELGDSADPWAQKAKNELLAMEPRYREWVVARDAELLNKQMEAKSHEEFYQRVLQGQEHFQKGNDFFKNGKYEEAMKEYDHALYLSPGNSKIMDARKRTILEISKRNVKEQSEQALKRLEAGDTLSARHEIQKMLTTIPTEPIMVSPQ